jgi:hypothetical protein
MAPTISPLWPPPHFTSSNCKTFHCSISYRNGSPSTMFLHLNLFHSPSPLWQVPPQTYTLPILQSYLSLLIYKSMFKGISWYIPAVNILYFGPFNPFHLLFLIPSLPSPTFFNNFQCISLCPLPSQMLCFTILLMLSINLFSFPSFPKFHRLIPCYKHALFWGCIWFCLFLCICLSFGSIFHIWEKTYETLPISHLRLLCWLTNLFASKPFPWFQSHIPALGFSFSK